MVKYKSICGIIAVSILLIYNFKNMSDENQISKAPMMLGIIGGILALPATIYSGTCAPEISTLSDGLTKLFTGDAGISFLWIGLNIALIGLISAFLYKKNTIAWGVMMLFAGFLSGSTLTNFNFLSLIVCILFIAGGFISLIQKKPAL
jgi:hypothetical protein